MSIGYACLCIGVPDTSYQTCILKNATHEKLESLIEHNLDVLECMIDYNVKNRIQMFRISSDIIPFGSHNKNTFPWAARFTKKLQAIGRKAMDHNIRLSMHPGQYTVLNSPKQEVVDRSIADLIYHTKFLDALGLDSTHKIILHIGGIYGDKDEAMSRFIKVYERLDDAIKRRLIIENDDKMYTINDVMKISEQAHIPVVFDNLHHEINHVAENENQMIWIERCKATWQKADGNQKIHYSQQAQDKKLGSHSATIAIQIFMDFYKQLNRDDLDIMLEVKDKNVSAIKCINCTETLPKMKYLETEWGRYKYTILERDAKTYMELRTLLKDKQSYPCLSFYQLIEEALTKQIEIGQGINAAEHVWGYFKKKATINDQKKFKRNIEKYKNDEILLAAIKRQLLRLSETYNETYLLNSYYFDL